MTLSWTLVSLWCNVSSECNHDLTVWYGPDGEPLLTRLNGEQLLVKNKTKAFPGNGMAWFLYGQAKPNKLWQVCIHHILRWIWNLLCWNWNIGQPETHMWAEVTAVQGLIGCLDYSNREDYAALTVARHSPLFYLSRFCPEKMPAFASKMQANLWQISLCCHRTKHGLLLFDIQFHQPMMFQVHHEILQRCRHHKLCDILHVINSVIWVTSFLKGMCHVTKFSYA